MENESMDKDNVYDIAIQVFGYSIIACTAIGFIVMVFNKVTG